MPVREKRPRSAGSCPARPFSRPSHTQTAAKLRGFSQTAQGFTAETDSPLEEDGFEPSVPAVKKTAVERGIRLTLCNGVNFPYVDGHLLAR